MSLCSSEVVLSRHSAKVVPEISNVSAIVTVISTSIFVIYVLLRHLCHLLHAVYIYRRLCLCLCPYPCLVLDTVPCPYPDYSSANHVSLSRAIVIANVTGTSCVISFFSCRDRDHGLCRRLFSCSYRTRCFCCYLHLRGVGCSLRAVLGS